MSAQHLLDAAVVGCGQLPFPVLVARAPRACTRLQGARERMPDKWPQELRDLVGACWAQDPDARPDFGSVYQRCARTGTCVLHARNGCSVLSHARAALCALMHACAHMHTG